MLDKNWFSEIDLHWVMTGIFDPIVALVNTVIIFDAVLIAAFIVIVGFVVIVDFFVIVVFVVIVSILAVVCGGFGEIIAPCPVCAASSEYPISFSTRLTK